MSWQLPKHQHLAIVIKLLRPTQNLQSMIHPLSHNVGVANERLNKVCLIYSIRSRKRPHARNTSSSLGAPVKVCETTQINDNNRPNEIRVYLIKHRTDKIGSIRHSSGDSGRDPTTAKTAGDVAPHPFKPSPTFSGVATFGSM